VFAQISPNTEDTARLRQDSFSLSNTSWTSRRIS
jgi:hypothetical protein